MDHIQMTSGPREDYSWGEVAAHCAWVQGICEAAEKILEKAKDYYDEQGCLINDTDIFLDEIAAHVQNLNEFVACLQDLVKEQGSN